MISGAFNSLFRWGQFQELNGGKKCVVVGVSALPAMTIVGALPSILVWWFAVKKLSKKDARQDLVNKIAADKLSRSDSVESYDSDGSISNEEETFAIEDLSLKEKEPDGVNFKKVTEKEANHNILELRNCFNFLTSDSTMSRFGYHNLLS